MFYLVGLGLFDEKDVSLRGIEVIKGCARVYLESYTSILMIDKERLEGFYGREVIVADRDMVETDSDELLRDAQSQDVALLVVGDPLGATTHTDIILRARALKIPTQVIHNASIMNAAGACGLQLYNFGQTVSIPFWTDNWKPDSWLARIEENFHLDLHTLLLLDIKVKEQNEENLARGRKIFEPPRYMSPTTALQQVLAAIESTSSKIMEPSTTLGLTLSRLGAPNQKIVAGTLSELSTLPQSTFGDPLHAMVIVGRRLHPLEVEFVQPWAVSGQWRTVAKEAYGVKE
ncbi:diphthine synthase [Tulasnella sp. JGI-2019a]|nr:diphthine synthase [Tulasnella sp. JGI-2019a]KAG9038315.1 diphthine synthase [Tulasnella sp. JGI-2019a]